MDADAFGKERICTVFLWQLRDCPLPACCCTAAVDSQRTGLGAIVSFTYGHTISYKRRLALSSVWMLWLCQPAPDSGYLLKPVQCGMYPALSGLPMFPMFWPDVHAWFLAGSTSSSLCEHWVSRLPGSKQPSIASAASSRRTSLASLSESVELTGERSEDDGVYQHCSAWGSLFLLQDPY